MAKNILKAFANNDTTARISSLFVAECFEKRHNHVLRDISKITAPDSGLSENFVRDNFKEGTYLDKTGRKLPCYYLTHDGFTLLIMGYTGQKAVKFKEEYIKNGGVTNIGSDLNRLVIMGVDDLKKELERRKTWAMWSKTINRITNFIAILLFALFLISMVTALWQTLNPAH